MARSKALLQIAWTAATVETFATASMWMRNMENKAQARTQSRVSRRRSGRKLCHDSLPSWRITTRSAEGKGRGEVEHRLENRSS